MRLIFVAVALVATATAFAVPQRYNYGHDTTVAIQEMRDSIDDLRHELHNHETEIRTFEEKVTSQENIIETLRDQLANNNQSNQDLMKGNSANLEMKINSLDTATKGLVADLKQFKSHATETSNSLAACNKKIAQLEKIIEAQNQNMDNLQAALKSLMDALDVKGSEKYTDSSMGKTYRVKSGDSLEKIARSHQTTIRALKELNNLNHDRIVIGQTLKIP